jgi:Peptidase family S41
MRLLAVVVLLPLAVACGSGGSKNIRSSRIDLTSPDQCRPQAEGKLDGLQKEPALFEGPLSLSMPVLLQKTLVQIFDHYYDARRVQPSRMLAAMIAVLAEYSGGGLKLRPGALVAADDSEWTIPKPRSVWELTIAARSVGGFIYAHLPHEHRLAKGSYAESLMINAVLSTLDRDSMFLPLGMIGLAGRIQPRSSLPPESHESVSVSQLPDGVVEVRPGPFVRQTATLLRKAIEAAAANNSSGLILDLRGNPGGLVDFVEQMADLFLAKGPLVTVNGRDHAETSIASDDKLVSEKLKLAVLIDKKTTSGAEMLAGALRFGDRAILLGDSTAGQGSILTIYDDGAGYLLALKAGEAMLPGPRAFDGLGIAPDLETAGSLSKGEQCRPVGETLAVLQPDAAGTDVAVASAVRILSAAKSAARKDLLAAAHATP